MHIFLLIENKIFFLRKLKLFIAMHFLICGKIFYSNVYKKVDIIAKK